MSKRPTDGYEPAAKKRGSERQLTRDDVSDDEAGEQGTIQMAGEEVLKTRKIVKARRGTAAPPSTPAGGVPSAKANPFVGVSLQGVNPTSTPKNLPKEVESTEAQAPSVPEEVPPAPTSTVGTTTASVAKAHSTASVEAQDTGKTASQETVKNKATAESAPTAHSAEQTESPVTTAITPPTAHPTQSNGSIVEGSKPAGSFASFTGSAPFASVAANKPLFSFGNLANASGNTGLADDKPKPFSFGPLPASSNFSFAPIGGSFPVVPSVFGPKSATSMGNGSTEEVVQEDSVKPALAVLPPEAETVTGEEDERQIWVGEGTLYEFTAEQTWKERGKGEMRINRGPGRPARFVLRQRGLHRLLMNANLWQDMKVTRMDGGKGATFPVLNAAQKGDETDASEPKMQTFAFRVKSAAQMDAFINAVETNKKPVADT